MKLHSYLSNKCEVRTKNGIKGVYCKKIIKKGELVAIWGGKIYSKKEVENIGKSHEHFLTHPVSVFEGYFLGPTNINKLDDVEYMNHSCDPNVGIKGQIILISRRKITPGEEVCFDYETTETHQEKFKCTCGSKYCRGNINGDAWQDIAFQKKNKGFFSWYIEERIKQRTKSKTSL